MRPATKQMPPKFPDLQVSICEMCWTNKSDPRRPHLTTYDEAGDHNVMPDGVFSARCSDKNTKSETIVSESQKTVKLALRA